MKKHQIENYALCCKIKLKGIQILYPKMQNISYGKIEQYPDTDSTRPQFALSYSGGDIDRIQLKSWLQKRLNEKKIALINSDE